MKKTIQITEKQYQTILESVDKGLLNEEYTESDFSISVPVRFEGPRSFHGRNFDITGPTEIMLNFNITVYFNRYGVDEIRIENLRGPKSLTLSIDAEPEDEYDENGNFVNNEELEHNISLDWNDEVNKIYPDSRSNVETSVQELEIELDEGLFVKTITAFIE
jgi:hypothetical protein